MPKSVKIRRATETDAQGIYRVHVDAVRHLCTLHYTASEIEAWVGRLRPGSHETNNSGLEFFVAVDDGEDILGFTVLDPAQSEVRGVFVRPNTSRRGIGGVLLRQIEDVARERELQELHLDASLNSVEFYMGVGYEPVEGRRHRLRSGVEIRCVLMAKTLQPHAGGGRRLSTDMPVFLVPYDESWPDRFEEERRAIVQCLGRRVLAVEHIGSTAVPGIMAKPVIDIMVVVPNIAEAPTFFDLLEQLKYLYFPYDEKRTPERRWFCKPNRTSRTHHLHLVESGSRWHHAVLAFRDFLREHRDEAARYETLKRDLASRFPGDREAYTEGKAEFVRGVVEKINSVRRG